jgi:hypothetical protein
MVERVTALKSLVVTLAFLGLILVALVVGCSPAMLGCERLGYLGGAAEIVAPEPATEPTPVPPPEDGPPH